MRIIDWFEHDSKFVCLDSDSANLKVVVFSLQYQLIRPCGMILSGHVNMRTKTNSL